MLFYASSLWCRVSYCKGLSGDILDCHSTLPSRKNYHQSLLLVHLTFSNSLIILMFLYLCSKTVLFLPKLPCISPNCTTNILCISSKHDAKSPTLLLKYFFNTPWPDSTMLVVLHPRCMTLFVHALTNFSLRFNTVVSTYAMNSGNGMHTSLNFNKLLAYDSSIGDSTNSVHVLTTFLTTSLFFTLFFFNYFLSTIAPLGGFGLTLQSVMHLALTFFPIWKNKAWCMLQGKLCQRRSLKHHPCRWQSP